MANRSQAILSLATSRHLATAVWTAQQHADVAGRLEWAMHYVDGTIVRAHQHAAGSPKGAEAEALGRSQGGCSTKIHLRAASDQHLMTFVLTPGQRHEAMAFE